MSGNVKRANRTGIPPELKKRFEEFSGFSFDDVRVRYNSGKPAKIGAFAYTIGNRVYIARGQEKYLEHELAHVVQQKQGKVAPTKRIKGMYVNDDEKLEQEADMLNKFIKLKNNRAAQAVKVVQMAANPASNGALLNIYNDLLRCPEFIRFERLLSPPGNQLTLQVPPADEVDYDPATHTIRSPITGNAGAAVPDTTIAANILWEMHNAHNRGSFNRADVKFLPGPDREILHANPEKNNDFYNAASALANEWFEWMNVIEFVLRTDKINGDIVNLPPPPVAYNIAQFFINEFPLDINGRYDVERGWFLFRNYLTDQINTGHTAHYDPKAGNGDWYGKKFLAILKQDDLHLKITSKQIADFLSGTTAKVKKPENCPFNTVSFIKEASRGL